MKVLRKNDVAAMFGVKPRTLEPWVRKGIFPAPFYITPFVPLWDADDIDAFLRKKKAGESHGSNEGKNESVGTVHREAGGDLHPAP